MTPSIYGYVEPRLFLKDVLALKQRQNPLFSLRAWAKQMGFRCHTSLVFLLNGKRKILPDHLEKLNRGLRLEGDEENYLRVLIQYEAAKSEKEKAEFAARLKILAPTREQSLMESEKFHAVSDWIHMAILEMTKLKDFKDDASWIASRLGFGATAQNVKEAVERLLAMNLLERRASRLVKTHERLTTPKDRASECIREHHRQVLANAQTALAAQSTDERVFNSCTMTVDANRLPEAKELILKFRTEMAKLMETEGGSETYQLSVQFFRLTTPAGDCV